MNRTFKIFLYSFVAIAIVVLITTIAANIILKNKLENFIAEGLPNNMVRTYDDISVHTLEGSITLNNPSLIIKNDEDQVEHTFIKAERLRISDISYWAYLFKKEIHIGEINLENPSFEYYKDRVIKKSDTIQKKSKIGRPIFIDNFKINDSRIAIYEKGKDSTKLYTENLSFDLKGIQINEEILNKKIPFEHKEIKINGDSLFLKANPYENLIVKSFSINNKDILFNDLKYFTKYSRAQLSRIREVQRDHFDLTLKSLLINDFNYGFKDTLFFATSKKISLNSPSLDIYRDKLLAPDTKIKPLYSKALRELPFELTVDSLKINDAFLKYEERVHEENTGGFIEFKDLNAKISNVSNTYQKPEKTDVKIKAIFMDNTPFSVDWNFDIQDPHDRFVFKGDVGAMKADKMNRFTEPNMKVRLEGEALQTYFTIDGNNENSTTDLKIKYSEFKVTVLQKDGKKKNKFLSAVVNILVSKDSEKKEDNFREATGEATRNKTKSVFNQLWISIQSALQKSMI